MATGTVHAYGYEDLQRARVASIGNVLAGVWLIAAPFVLNFEQNNAAQWNHVIVGIVVAALAGVRASDPDHREGISWMNVALGVWMIAAPFVLDYAAVEAAQTNSIVVGAVILALAAFSWYETKRAHDKAGRSEIRREGPGT